MTTTKLLPYDLFDKQEEEREEKKSLSLVFLSSPSLSLFSSRLNAQRRLSCMFIYRKTLIHDMFIKNKLENH